LTSSGFSKVADQNYKFSGNNLKVLELTADMLKERLSKGSLGILKVEQPVEVVEEKLQD